MGTRSCVIVKVRPSDKDKVMRFKPTLVPVPLQDWRDVDFEGRVWRDETGKERSQDVKLTGDYIGIYCHWDGYVKGGVGETLKEKFADYDTALNLVIGGFCSSVGFDGVKRYAIRGRKDTPWVNEKWIDIKPVQGKTQKSVFSRIDCEYVYLYDEERGGWLYKHYPRNKSGFRVY